MTPQQKKHQEEYDIAKKKYERAYSEKKLCDRKLGELLSEKQANIKEINSQVTKKKRIDETATLLSDTNEKDSEIDRAFYNSAQNLLEADQMFSRFGDYSRGNVKSLENVFAEKNKTTKSNISEAFSKIKTAKIKMNEDSISLKNSIAKLQTKATQINDSIRKYTQLAEQANRDMQKASIDMAFHKKHLEG